MWDHLFREQQQQHNLWTARVKIFAIVFALDWTSAQLGCTQLPFPEWSVVGRWW